MFLLLVVSLIPGAFCSVPVVTGVQLSVNDRMRHVTLQYRADEKPVILWKNSDYYHLMDNSTNIFSDGEGESSMWMYMKKRGDNLRYPLSAEIFSDSYHMSVLVARGDVRLMSSASSSVPPVRLLATPDGTISFNSTQIIQINLTVESDDLSEYTVDDEWGDLESFEYNSYPPVSVYRRRAPVSSSRSGSVYPFVMPAINETSITEASTTVSLNMSHPFMTGQYEFGVVLVVKDPQVVSKIILRRYVYVQNSSDESPFRRKANFVYDERNRKRTDMVLKDYYYTQIDAMGYPKPVLKLYRGCTELTEPEVKVFNIGTPYRSRSIIQFRNNSGLEGVYYFTAVSGDTEIKQMKYIRQLS